MALTDYTVEVIDTAQYTRVVVDANNRIVYAERYGAPVINISEIETVNDKMVVVDAEEKVVCTIEEVNPSIEQATDTSLLNASITTGNKPRPSSALENWLQESQEQTLPINNDGYLEINADAEGVPHELVHLTGEHEFPFGVILTDGTAHYKLTVSNGNLSLTQVLNNNSAGN